MQYNFDTLNIKNHKEMRVIKKFDNLINNQTIQSQNKINNIQSD